MPKKRIILPLDVGSVGEAIGLVEMLKDHVGLFKIGLELINTIVASIVAPKKEKEAIDNFLRIRELFNLLGGNIMWDIKLHDIPNTVAGASKAISKMGVMMFNFHASGGIEAAKAAVANKGNALALGVTVLTSLSDEQCISIFGDKPGIKVIQFANMLVSVGADGIICSPKELGILQLPDMRKLKKVIPGIRPIWAQKQDQERVMTPGEAIKAGADYVVVGRPITNPPDEIGNPVDAAKLVAEEISEALSGM